LFVFCFVFLRYSKENQLISLFSLPGAVAAQEEVEEGQSWLLHAPPPRPAELRSPTRAAIAPGLGDTALAKERLLAFATSREGKAQRRAWSPAQGGRGAQPRLPASPASVHRSPVMGFAHESRVKNSVCCVCSAAQSKKRV